MTGDSSANADTESIHASAVRMSADAGKESIHASAFLPRLKRAATIILAVADDELAVTIAALRLAHEAHDRRHT